MTKVFIDMEFTGLHQNTSLISLGAVGDDNKEFYAELTDYDKNQVDDWIKENVLNNLLFNNEEPFVHNICDTTLMKGGKEEVSKELKGWLSKFEKVEIVTDLGNYDIMLFHSLFGTAFDIPKNVYYINYDLCSLLFMAGLDPDVSREAFIDYPIEGDKHNALYDAKVIRACYDKLRRNKHKYKINL